MGVKHSKHSVNVSSVPAGKDAPVVNGGEVKKPVEEEEANNGSVTIVANGDKVAISADDVVPENKEDEKKGKGQIDRRNKARGSVPTRARSKGQIRDL